MHNPVRMEDMVLSIDYKRLVFVIFSFVISILSGAAISIWAVSLGDSVRYLGQLWVSVWTVEEIAFLFAIPRHRRDWIAHICGICVAGLSASVWVLLIQNYSWFLGSNATMLSGILTIWSQIATMYLVSSHEYRQALLSWPGLRWAIKAVHWFVKLLV